MEKLSLGCYDTWKVNGRQLDTGLNIAIVAASTLVAFIHLY